MFVIIKRPRGKKSRSNKYTLNVQSNEVKPNKDVINEKVNSYSPDNGI